MSFQKKERFTAIDGLKFLAFLNIFILHSAAYSWLDIKYSGAGAVSFFITSSGFMYGYRLDNPDFNISIKHIIKKILTLYPLHLVLILLIGCHHPVDLKIFIIHLALIQSYFSDESIYFGLNGPSWYLSAYIFLQFLLIPLTYLFRKLKDKKSVYLSFMLIFILNGIYINVIHFLNLDYQFWLYVFPPARIAEFACGMLTGIIVQYKNTESSAKAIKKKYIYSINEIISVIIVMALIYIVNMDNIFEPWMTRTEFWIMPLCYILYVFSQEKGIISGLLGSKPFKYLSTVSYECYMIHCSLIVDVFGMLGMANISRRSNFILWWSMLCVTICLSFSWKYLQSYITCKIKTIMQK